MNKRFFYVSMVLLISFSLMATVSFASGQSIKLLVNGKEVASDVAPQLINNRVMVPIRAAAEMLGVDVQWLADENTVKIQTQQVIPAPAKQSADGLELGNGYNLVNSNIYRDGLTAYAVGEVRNNSGKAYQDILLTVTFVDSNGNPVGSREVRLPIDIQPGDTTLFSASLYDGARKVKGTQFKLVAKYTHNINPLTYTINWMNTKIEDSRDGRINVEGELDFDRPGSRIETQVGIYDNSGKLLSVGSDSFSTKSTQVQFSINTYNALKFSNVKVKLLQVAD